MGRGKHPTDPMRDKHGRWLPGFSGGPGRPKGSGLKHFRAALKEIEAKHGKDVLANKLLEMALAGDMQAMKLALNYKFGTPAQSIDMTHTVNNRVEDMTDEELEAIAAGEE